MAGFGKHHQEYFTEVSLLQATKGVALLKPAEFEKLDVMLPQFRGTMEESHVYFVCERPRVGLVEAGKRGSEGIRFSLEIATNNKTDIRRILVPHKLLPAGATSARILESGTYFTFINGIDDITPFMPPEALLSVAFARLPELANLEVVYIGQAYGHSGRRSAVDRLKSHVSRTTTASHSPVRPT